MHHSGDTPAETDHLYRLIVQNIPHGDIYLFDHDLRYILAAGTTLGRHGFDGAAFAGRSIAEIAGEELTPDIEALYTEALAGREAEIDLEYEARFYRLRSAPIRDEQGRVLMGIALSQDITRLKQMERETQRLNEQLQALLARERSARAEAESQRALLRGVLDQAPSMMCILQGPQYVYGYVNEIYCKALGRTADELLGRGILAVFPELVNGHLDQLIHDVYRTGEPFRAAEMRVDVDLHQDGTLHEMYFTFSYQPIRDAEGQVSGIVVHAVNVTDQVQARRAVERQSAEVARLNEELEQRVRELADTNQELEAFAYSVSHDLRAPLRHIEGFGRALLDQAADRLDEPGRRHLARIRAAAKQMGELIDALLALARVSRQELQTGPVHLSRMASDILAKLRENAPDRQVTARIAPDLIVRGDDRLLRIALQNLLENAWKFTSKKPAATIEVGTQEQDGERVYFVRDDGAGFDPAYTKKLFGTFNRLHSPGQFPGVGIGLVTVKRAIERHGGRIWAHGEVDRGATFYFTLPGL